MTDNVEKKEKNSEESTHDRTVNKIEDKIEEDISSMITFCLKTENKELYHWEREKKRERFFFLLFTVLGILGMTAILFALYYLTSIPFVFYY